MPLYDYKCHNCEHVFTLSQRISARKEPEDNPCPKCSSLNQVKQVIGAPPVVSGVVGAGSIRKPQWFTDKIKDMKKVVGKGHTLDNC